MTNDRIILDCMFVKYLCTHELAPLTAMSKQGDPVGWRPMKESFCNLKTELNVIFVDHCSYPFGYRQHIFCVPVLPFFLSFVPVQRFLALSPEIKALLFENQQKFDRCSKLCKSRSNLRILLKQGWWLLPSVFWKTLLTSNRR